MAISPKQTVQNLSSWPNQHPDRRSKIRLDSGEHPEGFAAYYPFDLSAELVSTYPSYTVLLPRLAEFFRVPVDHLMLSNGSDNGLALIAETFIEPGADRAICNAPSFVVIPHSLHLCGAWLNAVPLNSDFSCNVEEIERLLASPTKLVMVASPDNPSGTMIAPDVIERWCQSFPNTLFVVDEAYYEFTEITVLPLTMRFDNLLVTRTFSKAWAMAGLRVGVIIGNPHLINSLAVVRPLFDINAVAAQAVDGLLDHYAEIQDSAREIMRRKQQVVQKLTAEGFHIHEGAANFYLLDMGEDAVEFGKYCESAGVLVRVCAPTADPANALYGKVRVSIGTVEQNDRFATVANSFRYARKGSQLA